MLAVAGLFSEIEKGMKMGLFDYVKKKASAQKALGWAFYSGPRWFIFPYLRALQENFITVIRVCTCTGLIFFFFAECVQD